MIYAIIFVIAILNPTDKQPLPNIPLKDQITVEIGSQPICQEGNKVYSCYILNK